MSFSKTSKDFANELLLVPRPRNPNKNQKQSIPAVLDLTDATRTIIEQHISLVGLDKHLFAHTIDDQNRAYHMLTTQGLHIPNEIDRDIRSKYSIWHTSSSIVHMKTFAKGQKGRELKRYVRCYQCLCGTDSSQDRRLIPWKDVSCFSWIRLVTTHDENDENTKRLLAIDEISGVLDHSPSCKQIVEMDRDASIPLHPELKAFALSLLYNSIPLTQLRQMCKQWAVQRWGDAQGDNHFRFRLNHHDPSSLYRKVSHERGISPATAAEENSGNAVNLLQIPF
ncbi:hypothetical protein M378DRAFT_18475 [Amanita muscaria Koide BX008]|uniref:Uncharacterized protein n=1 Tax=Amanita muscaria (strain Koide BX008) TaxID=946122 RepID=A0A0C2RX20_AMAMK|nr:hypothetical protein M378DRAFT_18475 [Amanita muscaria Koide BX008]